MTDPRHHLVDLARSCLVRLGRDVAGAPSSGGSGVWIAPGTVLTCAHVVRDGPGSAIEVEWAGKILAGVVTDHVPNPGDEPLWPFPDLAVVSVAHPPAHPCAWLSERKPAYDARLTVFGHSAKLGQGLRGHPISGRLSGGHEFGAGEYWQVKGNEFVAGMSGGPVLDMATGAVCAVVTTTIGEGADRGGYVVPLWGLASLSAARRRSVLSEHDRFHAEDSRWTRIRQDLPAPPLFAGLPIEPAEEVEILGHLAALPAPDPVVPGPAPRDAFYRLLDEHGVGDSWIDPLFRLTHSLTGADPAPDRRGLYDWSTALAGRTGRRHQLDALRRDAATLAPAGVITVEIVPGAARVDRFRLTVSIEDDRRKRRVLHKESEPNLELAAARELANDHLRGALELLEGNALIEFVVPVELFDEPFDELKPGYRHTTLGRQHRVVLRDYDRQQHRAGRHQWRQRWQRLRGPSGQIRWMSCSDDVDPEELWSDLELSPDVGVLALTRRPTSNGEITELVRAALEAGVPAVVWRRDTCAEHDAGAADEECSGGAFRGAIDAVLCTPPVADLPERVRQLRVRAASTKAGDADRACRGTVLVWDDPGRATGGATLHEPPYRSQEP